MISMHRLDLMIAYSCNLSCKGCISLSDFKREGIAEFDEILTWVNYWSKLVSPAVVTLFGGEPCLHPKLVDICQLMRNNWPDSTIRLITNGYLLDNFASDVWFNFEPFEIQVSVHRKDHEALINQSIKQILKHRKDWVVSNDNQGNEHRQLTWKSKNFTLFKSIFKDFVVPYQQENQNIIPWNSDPARAHKICGSPDSPVLYKGKLYKCPAVANTIDLTGANWFDYQACADANTLEDFISNIGCPEKVCGQCPAQSQAVVINHFNKENVIVKQKITS